MIPIVAVLILESDDGQSWRGGDPLRARPAITDQIDGFLARRWHVESAFGRIADPLADRLLIDVDRHPALARRPPAVGRAPHPGAATSC